MNYAQYMDLFSQQLNHSYGSHYSKNYHSLLCRLCDEYGSDKGSITQEGHPYPWPAHTYADYYSVLFDHCRFHIRNIFECGLGTNNPNLPSSMGVKGKPGASLRVWAEYFPNAQIVGSDIDRDILFNEDRISTYYVDQTDPKSISDLWGSVGVTTFDFMIDDGLHTFDAGKVFFENSIHKLSSNGIYIIEDVAPKDLLDFKNYFIDKKYRVDYILMRRPNINLFSDNNLIVIRKN